MKKHDTKNVGLSRTSGAVTTIANKDAQYLGVGKNAAWQTADCLRGSIDWKAMLPNFHVYSLQGVFRSMSQ
jgi:hypothetical protein